MTNDEVQEIPARAESGATSKIGINSNLAEMFKFLARNEKIIFKSQQIDDPELDESEKRTIASDIFTKSHRAFLQRFGAFLNVEYLKYFQQLPPADDEPDVQYIANNFIEELNHKAKNVKNRRFAALKEMSTDSEGYFSEREMMRREPLLYEQLVGQYLTETERRARDRYDPRNTGFSSILLETIDKDQTEELRRKQKLDEGSEDETAADNSNPCSSKSNDNDDNMFPKEPPSFRKQWGNFEDDDDEANFTTQCKKQDTKQKYVTAEERDILQQEFLGIMHSNFLDGLDKDFDYSQVDDNGQYDDLEQIAQDKEDEYFDEGEENEIIERMQEDRSASEDELDLYMNSIK